VYREGGRTLSLPSYPWQRERFWYDQLEAYAAPATEPPPASAASSEHKLANGTRYLERWLHPRRPSYLADHVVGGAAVVPAAYFLDLALQTSMGGVLESVTFGKPAVIGPDGLEVQLVLAPDGRYELFGRAPGEPWRHLECGSSLPPSQPTEQPQGHGRFPANHPPGDRHTLLDWGQSLAASLVAATGARSLLTAEAHYQAMQSRGLVYGPACRTVKELWRGQGRAVARVELAPDTVTEDNWIHPTLLDGCFQTVAAAAPDEGGTLYGTGVYLPRGVRRLRLAGRAPSAVWCDVTLVGEPGGARLEADLVLYGGDGNVVAEIEGLELGRLDAALPQDISQCYYGIDWVERELDGTGAAGSWLILGDGGLARELVERLEERGCACSRLDTDENLEPRLASVLASREWTGVVFLEGLRCVEGDECSVPSNPGLGVSLASPVPPFRLDFETVASMVMATVRAIAGQPSRPRLFLVTRGAQNVAGWELDEAAPQACLWGFGRTLAVEHPEFWGGLVDLDGEADATALCRELTGNDGEAQVGYRGGRRHVARLAHRVLEPRPLRIRTHGTYLITGGTHGLGLEAARWLVRHGARRLILVGRTELPPRGQWGGLAPNSREARLAEAVRELEGLGAAVHLAAVDVGVEGALPRYVEGYRAEGYPPIIGIFHAAGVLDDHLAMRMTDAALRHALAPKLNGGREIARIAAAPEVELVVLYSSATGVLGQIGQAAYGAGNAYLDALARRRDGDRVGQRWISVAWGPWAEVGMYARQSIAEGSGPSGVTPLSPEDGARALAAAIASGESELLVLRAESAGVLARAGVGSTRLLEQLTPGSVGGSAPTAVDGDFVLDLLLAAPATRRRQLEDWLTERVARVLRTSQDRVTAGRPLVSMGVDSIMAVELRNTIDKELQITVPLVDLFASTIAALVGRLDQLLATDPRLGAVLDEVEALGADE
jgi:myxalamid-type polyketide synthase MxaE and MxaD